eukprot:261160_1
MLSSIVMITALIIAANTDQGCTFIDNNTCLIERKTPWNESIGNIVCDNRFSNCIILCDSADFACSSVMTSQNIHIKCPDNGNQCIIYCHSASSCKSTQILSSNTIDTKIIIRGNNAGQSMTINASTNPNGKLYVNVISDLYNSIVYAQASIININCDNANLCSHNKIFGQYTDKSITYSCDGNNVDCSYSDIYCPINPFASCHIYCASILCQCMNVYTINSRPHIDWECNNNNEHSCFNSKLYCGFNTNFNSINLIYDRVLNQWVFPNVCLPPSTTNIDIVENAMYVNDAVHSWTFMEFLIVILGLVFVLCIIITVFLYFIRKATNKMIQQQKITIQKLKHQMLVLSVLKCCDDDIKEIELKEVDNDRHEDKENDIKQIICQAFSYHNHSENVHVCITPTPSFNVKETSDYSEDDSKNNLWNDEYYDSNDYQQ